MDTRGSTAKLPWDAPATIALTDTDSRADRPDVALRNDVGPPPPSSLPG
jgi:hypothetical protein